jgi:hypothetical protein
MTNTYTKKCSVSVVIKEIQIKQHIFYLTQVSMAIIKGKIKMNAGEDVAKQEHLYTVGGNEN